MFINHGLGKFRSSVISEAVIAHVDSLISGDEHTSQLLEQHSNEASALEELFQVAHDLHEVLVPINPREQFVSELKAELKKSKAALLAEAREQHRRSAVRATNMAGTILSILAVTALLTRLIGVVVVIVAFLARRHRSVAPA